MVLPGRNSQRCQRNVGPGEAGCSQQSRQDTNLSCRDRVNSGCAEPTPFPSKTSCMHQRFSGNCIKPRRTRESIPHGKPGLRSRWASLLPCSQHRAAWILLPQQVTECFMSFPNSADLRASSLCLPTSWLTNVTALRVLAPQKEGAASWASRYYDWENELGKTAP